MVAKLYWRGPGVYYAKLVDGELHWHRALPRYRVPDEVDRCTFEERPVGFTIINCGGL